MILNAVRSCHVLDDWLAVSISLQQKSCIKIGPRVSATGMSNVGIKATWAQGCQSKLNFAYATSCAERPKFPDARPI